MTKEIIFEVENKSKKETNNMTTLDKIIIVWFFVKMINILYLLYKRYISK